MSDSALPRPPEVLEGFRVGALRRSAGALAVHAAQDRLDLPVEMHFVRADVLPPQFGPDAFMAALRKAADVRHESLLPYITGGRAGDLLFAAAKTTDAPALDEVLARGGALAEDRVLGIGAAVAGVLAALERAGLRHADLTPRRVLLPGRGQVAVGPPRLLPAGVSPRNERYLAPEEAQGGVGDVRSDLYVLGLLLAEAATGAPILKGSSSDVKRAIASGQVRFDAPGLRASTRTAIRTLLAADPATRFPRAAAAEAALLHALEHHDEDVHDVAPIATAVPLEDAPPETAPIPKGFDVAALRASVAAATAPSAAAPAAPPVAAAQRAAAEPSDPGAVRRAPGRLYLTGRLGDAMLEIDESVHVGWPTDAIDVAARPDVFAGAEFFVDRTEAGDVLVTSSPVRVNGKPVESCALQHGDSIEGPKVRARYERNVRTALKATGFTGGPPPNPVPARMVLLAAMLVALGGIAVSLPRFTDARRAKDDAEAAAALAEQARDDARRATAPAQAGPAPTAGPAAAREQAARDAFDAAKDWARKNPGDAAGARDRLRDVADRFGDTGHGAIARAELAEAERRARGTGAGGGELEKLLASARTSASEGRLDDALKLLRDWSEMHPATVSAERATATAVQLEAEITGRFEGDAGRFERALTSKDVDGAFRILGTIMDYVPRSLRDRALEMRRRAEAARDGVELPPKTPTAGPDTPPKPPDGPPKPPEGPGRTPDDPPPSGPPPSGPPTTGDREKDADAAFKGAKKLMEAGKDPEAIDALLAFLRDWRDTRTGAKYDVEARGRVTALAQGPAGIAKLFRGKVEKADKGRWRISYDFSDAKQIEDFRDVEAFEAPPRAAWKVSDGWVRTKGSGALVLDATFAIDQIVASATVNPERAHDLGVAFLDASEQKRFYLFTLQNRYFTLGKGEGAKVFEENAIVLFGPNMWRDTPPGQLGFVRKCGSPEPAVVPGTSLPMKCGKSEATVWMRLRETKNISGSAYGDVRLDFQGIEPGLFVLNSAGAFDDFVVEGTPDPEWVAQRWRGILSGL